MNLPAPSTNPPTHAPSNTTNAPTYASSSLVKDGGTTALTSLLSLAATAAPVETFTLVADALLPPELTLPTTTAPTPTATATPTTSFVKLNLI